MRKTARHPASRSAPPRRGASAVATDATNRSIGLDDRLYSYLCKTTLREPELMVRLRAETSRLPRGTMQISPEQGQLMGLLVRLMGARRALEIGTFTGYSALAVASARAAAAVNNANIARDTGGFLSGSAFSTLACSGDRNPNATHRLSPDRHPISALRSRRRVVDLPRSLNQ